MDRQARSEGQRVTGPSQSDWDDELWRSLNPGASAARGVLVGALAGITAWLIVSLIAWAIVAVIW